MELSGGLLLLGIFLTIFWIKAPRWLTTGIYLGMGWIVLIAIYPMIMKFNALGELGSLLWLLAGRDILFNWCSNIWLKMAKI